MMTDIVAIIGPMELSAKQESISEKAATTLRLIKARMKAKAKRQGASEDSKMEI
jgi:hypothetical protein